MLEQSQKLTDGLIIYSVLVSDYEKLDFKNDALAGVRANYFNSGCKEQKEITEIELHGMDYKMSCLLTKNEPLSWKVTRDNLPYQSVKRATGGVYSVITYNDRGIVFKRQFFDRNHTWLRTEYFNRSIADKLITRIYPRKVSGIITLVTEDIDDNGIVSVKTLFPSDKQSNENSRVLIYSNVGMLWYDASFLPSDMPFTEKKTYGNSGFVFNGDLFKNDFVPENAYNLEDCAYLTDEDIPNVSDTAEPVSKKDYSAYDIIEKILVEAHKTNKDLFGEIINHTAEEDFEPAEVKIVTGEKDEQLSDDEVEENSQISEQEIADDTDAVAETADEQTEDSESVVTVDSPDEASEDEETDFEKQNYIFKLFAKEHFDILDIAVGKPTSLFQLHISYQSAETALHSLIISSEHYVIFDDLTLELILSTITPENQKEFLAKTIAPLNAQELHLLEVYFSEEMSLAATSERLFLHKNTLQYKLNAIQKKCSLNPRKFQDAVLLYLAGKIK